METNPAPHHATHSAIRARAWKGAAVMLAIIAAFYLLREHWGHVFGALPYLLLLACPLMHLFGHGGHGEHNHGGHSHLQSGKDKESR